MKTFYDRLIYFRAGGVEAVPKRYHVPQTGVLGAHSTQKTCFGPTCFQMDDLFERARRVLGAGTMEDNLRENQRRRLTPSITQIVWLNNLHHYFNTERFVLKTTATRTRNMDRN